MQENGRDPLLGIVVEIEECYIHCAKAFIRSNMWIQNLGYIKRVTFSSKNVAGACKSEYFRRGCCTFFRRKLYEKIVLKNFIYIVL